MAKTFEVRTRSGGVLVTCIRLTINNDCSRKISREVHVEIHFSTLNEATKHFKAVCKDQQINSSAFRTSTTTPFQRKNRITWFRWLKRNVLHSAFRDRTISLEHITFARRTAVTTCFGSRLTRKESPSLEATTRSFNKCIPFSGLRITVGIVRCNALFPVHASFDLLQLALTS